MIDPSIATAPQLRFAVHSVVPALDRAVPALRLRLGVECDPSTPIAGIALTTRVQIAAERRRYGSAEVERLGELFGVPSQWPRSLGPVVWSESVVNVPAFTGSAAIDVVLPCSYDFDVAAAKYLAALENSDIPIDVLLSGLLFYHASGDGRLLTARLPWNDDLAARVPLTTWREAIDAAFPDTAWVRVERATLAALQRYRSRRSFTGWDETFGALLGENGT